MGCGGERLKMCFFKNRRKKKLKIILIRFEKSAAELTGGLTGLPFTRSPVSRLFILRAEYFDIRAFLAPFVEPSGTCSLIKRNNS